MRPKTFPTSSCGGSSQQMLQEIRNSLRNLSKPSDPPKADPCGAAKMPPEDPRAQGRCSNPKNPYHKALQEIRKSLMPFANEPVAPGPEVNKHMSPEPPFGGPDEVRCFWRRAGFLRKFSQNTAGCSPGSLYSQSLRNEKHAEWNDQLVQATAQECSTCLEQADPQS